MRILLVLCVVWLGFCKAWTLNDLYKDYIQSMKHSKGLHKKRGDISHNPLSNVKSFSVKPLKKYKRDSRKRDLQKAFPRPTQSISKFLDKPRDKHAKTLVENSISRNVVSAKEKSAKPTPGTQHATSRQHVPTEGIMLPKMHKEHHSVDLHHSVDISDQDMPVANKTAVETTDVTFGGSIQHLIDLPNTRLLQVKNVTDNNVVHHNKHHVANFPLNNTFTLLVKNQSQHHQDEMAEGKEHQLQFKDDTPSDESHEKSIHVAEHMLAHNTVENTVVTNNATVDSRDINVVVQPLDTSQQNAAQSTLTVQSNSAAEVQEAAELPDIHGLLSGNFDHQTFRLHDCHLEASSSACGINIQVSPNTCAGKTSFTAIMTRLLPGVELAPSSNDLLVHGKFDVTDFNIDRCQGRVMFNLVCRELLDLIPNKLRLINSRLQVTFSYGQPPKTIANFYLKINGLLNLDYRNRRLDVEVEKQFGNSLFKVEMTTADLEIPEFTKLFTDGEISQTDLPPDLATLVSSSLRNPRITGLYDSSGAFEFVASAKSPVSIFPSQPWVYLLIQKPRLGKVVAGLILSFEGAMFRSFLSSILNLDLSNIPLFSDIRTDMAIGISPDGLFVVKDENFNREIGSLFSSGRTILKGLTVKAKLPIQKIVSETYTRSLSNQTFPESTLINMQIKGNKIHMDFPEDLRINVAGVPELFSQHGQDINVPRDTMSLGETQMQVRSYDIDNVDKKSLTVSLRAPESMKIGSLMTLNDVEATLTRDDLSKWDFNAKGDYKLGNTSVPVFLTSKNQEYIISSKPSSIRSGFLVNILDKKRSSLTSDLRKYHLEDFVIEDFKVSGNLSRKNVIRFSGKPAVFGVDDGVIEFVATEQTDKEDAVAMGILFKEVDMDHVFGRMLDKKMQRRSWANGVNIGLIMSPPNTDGEFQFTSEGLTKTKVQPGVHLRALIQRPEYNSCKGDSLCKVLSSEMPRGSAFHLDGGIKDGDLKLSAAVDGTLYMSKSFEMKDVTFHSDVVDNGVQFYVFGTMNPRGLDIPFSGDMRVDNTGQLKLNMISQNSLEEPFGLNNVHLDNCTLSAAFEPGLPLPVFDLNGRLVLGKNIEDNRGIEAQANIKLNLQDPSKNSFRAKVKDLSFEKLANAFGSKQPLMKFQADAKFTDDAFITFDQPNKDSDDLDLSGERRDMINSTGGFHYKGDLKINGRMRLLGENADYTVKFLQKQTQLLIEVWLPDIGINQGLLTVRAGLKQRSVFDSKVSNGPTLLIRMDPQTNSAVVVGKVSTLGFSRISAIKVSDDGFSSTTFASLPGNVNTNISLVSPYQENIENADFQVSACLPIQDNVRNSLFKLLRNTATQTKKTLISAEERVTTTEKIYETTKSMIEKYKKRSLGYVTDIRSMAEVMKKLRNGIKRHCVKDCGDSCMGLPSWKKSGITLGTRNAIGAPTWDSCRHKIPDLNCITRCLGRKVIENVKANNKQNELQKIMGTLADNKRSLQDARSLVNRARNLVDSTLDGLERVNKEIRVGVDISKFLNDVHSEKQVEVTGVCFKDSLDNAERSMVSHLVNGTFDGHPRTIIVKAALDGNLDQNIAEGVAETLYPGFSEFSKKLEQVKMLLSNLDGERDDITKDIDNTTDQQPDQKSQVIWSTEEDEFRKLAFGELPRFTLSDDETIHAFEEKSIWQIAPTNDPLFDKAPGDNQIVSPSEASETFIKDLEKQSSCSQVRSSVNRYSDIIAPLSEFTEDFLQEKIMFYRQKNRRLADLRMIDDQIKSDCFLENCTMEDMDNALSYLGRARDGTLKWASVIDGQIEEQNKVALNYFSKRAEEIVKVDNGVTLRQYISKVKEIAQTAIKKSSINSHMAGAETDEKIVKLAKELHSLLLGVKNSEELSKVAPKIFAMKRQVQSLKRNKIECTDSKPTSPKKPSSVELIENKLKDLDSRRNTHPPLVNKTASFQPSINQPKPSVDQLKPSVDQAELSTPVSSATKTAIAKTTGAKPTMDVETQKIAQLPTEKRDKYYSTGNPKSDIKKPVDPLRATILSESSPSRHLLTEAANEQSVVQPQRYSVYPQKKQPTSNQYSPFSYWNNYIRKKK